MPTKKTVITMAHDRGLELRPHPDRGNTPGLGAWWQLLNSRGVVVANPCSLREAGELLEGFFAHRLNSTKTAA